MTIDVSIVIAAWNAEGFIARAIDSALAQTRPAIEVIVVDDASTDGTAAVADCYADVRVRTLRQSRNGGPSAARNAGFAGARGRWIAVLDADDTMAGDRLARMIARGEAMDAAVVVDNLDVVRDGAPAETMFPAASFSARDRLDLASLILSNRFFRSAFSL